VPLPVAEIDMMCAGFGWTHIPLEVRGPVVYKNFAQGGDRQVTDSNGRGARECILNHEGSKPDVDGDSEHVLSSCSTSTLLHGYSQILRGVYNVLAIGQLPSVERVLWNICVGKQATPHEREHGWAVQVDPVLTPLTLC
jgi:hypothetical protein